MNEITTIEQLEERIAFINEQSAKIIAENPGLNETDWAIENIPYSLFEDHRNKVGRSVNDAGNRLFYFAKHSYGKGARIVVYSVPMKFTVRQSIQVIEVESPVS